MLAPEKDVQYIINSSPGSKVVCVAAVSLAEDGVVTTGVVGTLRTNGFMNKMR